MGWREYKIDSFIKRYDPKLFVQKNKDGVLQILREKYALKPYEIDDITIHCLEPSHEYIMSLTDNWGYSGKPIDWGLEPIWQKLSAIDGWKPNSFINQDFENENRKVDEEKSRSFKNKTEDFVKDFHGTFKKTFADVNTASMAKLDKRKLKGD